eukprot:NP_494222.2 Uncharacterized protein CELE_K09F6.4 [Caenorhabditis elegans]
MAPHRVDRQTTDDPLGFSINLMQKISRIVNSIYLATELTAGTAKIYDLIAEFFNFGPDSFNQLQSIDMKQLKSGLESIVSIHSELTYTDIDKRAEQRFRHLIEIRKEVEGVGSLEDIKDAQANYKSELEAFKKATFDTSGIEEVLSAVKNINGAAANIEKYSHIKELDGGDRGRAQGDIFDLKKFISFKKYNANRTAIVQDENFNEEIQANENNVKKLKNATSVFQRLGSFVKNLQDVIDARGTKHPHKYTIGFIDGTFDPKKVAADLEDDWVQSVTHEMDLNTTIGLLLPVADYVSAIESSFKLSPSKQSKFLTGFKSSEAELSPVVSKVDSILRTSKQVSKCITIPLLKIKNMEEVEKLLQTIDSLKKTVDTLVRTNELVNWVKANDAVLEEVEALCSFTEEEDNNPKSSVPIKLKSLNSSKNYALLVKTLNQSSLFADAEFSEKLTTTGQQATDIIEGLQSLDAFYSSVTNHMTFFECLLNVADYDLIPLAIATLNKVRKMDVQPIRDGIDVVNDLFNVSSQLAELKTKLGELKDPNFSIAETPLSNPSLHTTAIGLSVRGIGRMKDEIAHGSDFDMVIENAEMVDQEMKKTGKKAINMVEFGARLKKLKTELEIWKSNITVGGPHRIRRSTTSLADYAHIFQNALKVGGVDDDLKKLMDAVEDLENSVTDGATKVKLKEVKASLSSLDSIGLQLSSFATPFIAIGQSFTELDAFFVSNRKIITTTAPIVSSSDASQGGQKASGGSMTVQPYQNVSGTTTAEPMHESTNLIMFIGIGCGIVLVSALIFVVVCFYKSQKKKREMDKEANDAMEKANKDKEEKKAKELAAQAA